MNETNEERKILTIVDKQGNQMEVEVVIAFRVETTGKEYVIYTKNEKDEQGNITIYVSAFIEIEGQKQLIGIVDEQEWEQIKEIIRQLAKVD